MKTILFSALLMLCLVSCKKKDVIIGASLNKTDVLFMQEASHANYAETDAGAVAAGQGNDDSVKMYGSMMVAAY